MQRVGRLQSPSLAGDEGTVLHPSQGSDPFSLVDPETVTRMLGTAGLRMCCSPMSTSLCTTGRMSQLRSNGFVASRAPNEVLRCLDGASAERALTVREILADHAGADGIWFDARAWIVAARRDLGATWTHGSQHDERHAYLCRRPGTVASANRSRA